MTNTIVRNDMPKDWWKNSVIYQIYPRSFNDSNGDGIGDLNGIKEKLPYLARLGIDCIWLSPVFKSPQDDNGYDISDYRDIDAMFGSLEEMEGLIEEAKKYNIYFLMDLVLNHSSDEHKWFIEAKKSKDNPYHDYYVWRDGVEGELPNDLRASFGGSAWEWVPELSQYYLHQFSVKQPDLNWENPKLRKEIFDMINWWIDKGVGGFRLDVIDLIAKEPDKKIMANGSRLHEFISEMSRECFSRWPMVTVGEAWSADVEKAKKYSNPDGSELSMVFQFQHSLLDQRAGADKWDLAPLKLKDLKTVYKNWQTGLAGKGWNSLFWNNHDMPRIVSRWGNDKEYRVESAKMFAALLHGMQGTPYIYQGEEIGMTNVRYPIEEYKDIETVNMYKERSEQGYSHEDMMESIYAKSRDNARTPMQWSADENAGFTTGTPWIKINPNYTEINVADQLEDEASIFNFYRRLIAFRKELPVLLNGSFEMLCEDSEEIFSYRRRTAEQELVVVCNFYGNEINYPDAGAWEDMKCIISNYADGEYNTQLRPYEARWYIKK